MEAIKPLFDDLIELADVDLPAAAGPDLPEVFEALARRAESVGWPFDTAAEAIRELARLRLECSTMTVRIEIFPHKTRWMAEPNGRLLVKCVLTGASCATHMPLGEGADIPESEAAILRGHG